MNKTYRDVAKVLYEVKGSPCCKVCVRCKEKEGNQHLSCVDCIEEGITKLVKHATPEKPYRRRKLSEWHCPCCNEQVEIDALNVPIEERDKFCANCGQLLDWSDQNEKNVG